MFRGGSVFDTADKANEEAKARSQFSASQNRFYLPPNAEAEIIILDKEITVGMFEHDIPIPGKKFKRYVPCIAAIPGMTCPLCRAGDRKTYRMFVSILDLSEYEGKGGKKVTRRKRLLPINQGDKEKWQAINQDTKKLHGTLRGTYIYMKRPNETRSSRIGDPFAIEGKLWQHMPEAELLKAYGHKAKVEGQKVIAPANDDITPFNYDAIFPFPDEEFVAKMEAEFGNGVPQERAPDAEAGDAPTTGSAADIDGAWEEELQEGAAEEAATTEADEADVTGHGEAADGGAQESAQYLTEVAGTLGLNVEEYEDWAGVEAAIHEARAAAEPEPEPEPPKPAPKPMLKRPVTPTPAAKPGLVRPGAPKPGAPKPGGVTRPTPKAPAPAPKPVFAKRPGGPGGAPSGPVRPNRGAFN